MSSYLIISATMFCPPPLYMTLWTILVTFLHQSWASLVAQLVENPPAMHETLVLSLGWEDPLEKG